MYIINRHAIESVYLVRWTWILAACIYLASILNFIANTPEFRNHFWFSLMRTTWIGNVFDLCSTDFPSYWLADLSHKMCLRIIGIASAMHIVGWPKIDLQILYLTGLGLPVRMKVPAHLMVDWVMRSLHLVAIELKSSPEFYRLVISSNVLPFCTCQNVANFICYLEFLPDFDTNLSLSNY